MEKNVFLFAGLFFLLLWSCHYLWLYHLLWMCECLCVFVHSSFFLEGIWQLHCINIFMGFQQLNGNHRFFYELWACRWNNMPMSLHNEKGEEQGRECTIRDSERRDFFILPSSSSCFFSSSHSYFSTLSNSFLSFCILLHQLCALSCYLFTSAEHVDWYKQETKKISKWVAR